MGFKKTETIDVMDAVGSNIRVDTYGWEVKRILPKINEDINDEWISDKTRYACDGLLKQRLDTPYVRENGKLVKTTWTNAFNKIVKRLNTIKSEKIAGIVGDLVDMESMLIFKEFFNKTLNSTNLECRTKKTYLNPNNRMNYIFNSTINGIEECDLILLVGTNPRLEATILNARIRKSYVQNKVEIFSIGNPGDLTYPYKIIGSNTQVLRDIIDGKHEVFEKLKKSKKPIIIIGESALKNESGKYVLESLKNFLLKNNHINEDWNAFNILTQNASRVGAIDLGLYHLTNENNFPIIDKLNTNKYELIYFLGVDELEFNKKEEFIIYQGTHGDRSAEIADVILPGAAYTEKNGHFVNLEGRIQKAFKASYPPGIAKEDWDIINKLSIALGRSLNIKNQNELEEKLINSSNIYSKIGEIKKLKINTKKNKEIPFVNSNIEIDFIDYYFSNHIARSSTTMNECRSVKNKLLSAGAEK